MNLQFLQSQKMQTNSGKIMCLHKIPLFEFIAFHVRDWFKAFMNLEIAIAEMT